MSVNSQDFVAYVNHLRAEHRRIGQDLLDVEALIAKDNEVQQQSVVWQALVELREDLSRHFAEEAGGGCLEQASSYSPRLLVEVAKVLHEHAKLMCELDDIVEFVKQNMNSPQTRDKLRGRLKTFAAQLRNHEIAESRILETASGIPVE